VRQVSTDPRNWTAALELLKYAATATRSLAEAIQGNLYRSANSLEGDIACLDTLIDELSNIASEAGQWDTDQDYGAHVRAVFDRWHETRMQIAEGEITPPLRKQ